MNVLALDPGGVTGAAMYVQGVYAGTEIIGGFDGFTLWLGNNGDLVDVLDALVIETFTVNAGTHKKDPVMFRDTTSIIGAARFVAFHASIPVHFQSPGQAKAFGTDAKLRRLGWFDPSQGGHRNDASRHLLTFLATNRVHPILTALTEDTP